jgi:malonate transporter MadL subunit
MLGVQADIGGVGFAMLLLLVISGWLQRKGWWKPPTEAGIHFWGSMYIPIVVAMAASQNVAAAWSGGMVAFLAGSLAVLLGFVSVAWLGRYGRGSSVAEER